MMTDHKTEGQGENRNYQNVYTLHEHHGGKLQENVLLMGLSPPSLSTHYLQNISWRLDCY